jgi:ribosomal protein S12 methylthiotransferase accessory factor
MSEIYPVEELEWQNNTVGNQVRPYAQRLQDLTEEESAELLAILMDINFQDDLHVYILIGLCADANTPWQDLRIGELKTLAAIAAGDVDEILDGCEWIAQINDLPTARLKVYSCIADLVQIAQDTESGDIALFESNLALMYGQETLQLALSLFNQETQYFGLNNLGANYEGSKMHQQLLAAYEKVRAPQQA